MGAFYSDSSTTHQTASTPRLIQSFSYCCCHYRRLFSSSIELFHVILPDRISFFAALLPSRRNYCRSASGLTHPPANFHAVSGFSSRSAHLTLTVLPLNSCWKKVSSLNQVHCTRLPTPPPESVICCSLF